MPLAFWLMAIDVPLAVFLAWAEIKLPALVVSEVTAGQTFVHAATAVGILLGAILAATVLREFCSTILSAYLSRYLYRQGTRIYRKSMHCFYQIYEQKSTHDLLDRAQMATWMSDGKVKLLEMPQQSIALVKNLLCYAEI